MCKRVLVLLAVILLAAGGALADFESDYYIPPSVEEGQYPVVSDGSVSFSYWMPLNRSAVSFIQDNDENAAYSRAQEITGVDYSFIHPALGQETEQFKLMLASGDLPDLIQISAESAYAGGLQQMYEDGIIVDITPYLAQYAPQYNEVIHHDDTAMRQVTSDGKVLGFYKLTYADAVPWDRANLRADWLAEFGLESPLTIADFEAYFEAIQANKPEATPLYLNFESAVQMMPFLSAFDMVRDYYVDDGVVKHFWSADQLKDFLTLMSQWYAKGFLSKDFASLTETEVFALFDSGNLGMYVGSCDNCAIRALGLGIDVTNARYMRKEPDAAVRTEITSYPVAESLQTVTVITTACKDVEAAVAALNYPYTKEGALLFTFGVEGEHWNCDPDTGIPTFTEFMTNNPNGMTISNVSYVYKCHISSRYVYPDSIGIPSIPTAEGTPDARSLWAKENDPNVNAELRLPPIKLNTKESEERNEIMTEVNAYGLEMMLKFIIGAEPLDSFDAYLKTVGDMGLTRAIEITQGAYERFIAE